jgi:hypothetical protein
MKAGPIFEVCHGCGGVLSPAYEHWVALLGGRDKKVHFHNECYKHYRRNHAHNVRWAQQNERAK